MHDIADWAKKKTKSGYDCVAAVSGGKDSMKIALTAKDELGHIRLDRALDDDVNIVNQFLKYVKLGWGAVTDEVSIEIREGRLSRKEGLKQVQKYDGKCGSKYIKNFCKYIGIDSREFWKVVDQWRKK